MDKFQTLGSRIFASIVDAIILMSASLILFISLSQTEWLPEDSLGLSTFISLSYYVLLHYFLGQTLGKKIANVKVLDKLENPISFGQSLIRSLPQLILLMFCISFSTVYRESSEMRWGLQVGIFMFSLVDTGFFFANAKYRALHDFIAGTIVVRTDV